MDPSQDFKSLQEQVQASLLSATRTVNRIASEDLAFQRTAHPSTGDRLDEQSARLLSLSTDLLRSAGKATDQKSAGILEDVEDVEIQWRTIVDVVDGLLEKADICLDEYTGLVKRKSDFPEPAPAKKAKTNDRLDYNVFRANIIKPQNAFESKVDNFAHGPWKPILTQKPHATLPLEDSSGITVDENNNEQYDYTPFLCSLTLNWSEKSWDDMSQNAKRRHERRTSKLQNKGSIEDSNDHFRYKHPYETEILNLKYPATVYEVRDPIPYQSIEKTSAIWVDTFDGVLDMLKELKQATEIAVDLEHHDYRSYHGLLSLMQISTREKDWVVDTLRPWRQKLEILNEVFADPKILKVFHGAFMDIIWLQRDLGLYVVGLFDTYHACVCLDYPGKSLAYLLKRHVDFDADKKYQMADWRIRPLTEEMLYYARCDTHYLLYVFDLLRNELVSRSDQTDPQKNLIEYTLQKSKDVSLDRYNPFTADPSTGEGARGWAGVLQKTYANLDGQQFAVYQAVHKWRDELARQEDENPNFIMPQQTVMEVAKILPNDPKALWSLMGHKCSQKAKQSLGHLFKLIADAKKSGANGPGSIEFFRSTYTDSIAAVAKREFSKEVELPPVEQLQSQTSQLFGSVPLSSAWEDSARTSTEMDGMLISLPWTQFVQEAVQFAAQEEAQAKVKPNFDMILLEDNKPTVAAPKPAAVDNTEFTLRQGRKRKLEDVKAEESDSEDEGGAALDSQDMISLDVDEPQASRRSKKKPEKAAKKAAEKAQREAKRQAKRERKQRRQAEQATEDGLQDEDEEAFDYSKAGSVLHAQRGVAAASATNQAPGRKKAFDPYAARMNAEGPKAARRMHSERPGKTATFKK